MNEKLINPLKILIVEDDEISSQLITLTAKKFAREIIYAFSGEEALEISLNHPDLDLIMMDMQMPDMNGYETTRKIREFNASVIIIAQTAYAMIGDKEKTLDAGCNDYLSKPIKRDHLIQMIEKHFGK